MDRSVAKYAGITFALMSALSLTACDDGQKSAAAPPPPPAVTVVQAVAQAVSPSSTFTGKVQAVDRIDLRARIDGFLEQRNFTEGNEVEKGALLLTIEKGPYEVRVAEAKARIARAEAALRLAQVELDRNRTLLQQKVVAQSKFDESQSAFDVSRADLTSARADLDKATIDLSYTEIRAPIAGRIGRTTVSVGNYVSPANGSLATLVSEEPMYVVFPVTERELMEARKSAAVSGKNAQSLKVQIRLADGQVYPHSGTIDFIDVQVAGGTNTVSVRAVMPNPDRLLIDGQLINAIIEVDEPDQLPVIPQQALQSDQQGVFVLIVDGDNKAQVRRIRMGPHVGGGKIAIQDGLKEGDKVITEGGQRVRPQQVVSPVDGSVVPAPSRS